MLRSPPSSSFFFFNDTATTEIYTLSLHDALPILSSPLSSLCVLICLSSPIHSCSHMLLLPSLDLSTQDRKSTRLNSSHQIISYAVFCLKKKNITSYVSSARLACGSF